MDDGASALGTGIELGLCSELCGSVAFECRMADSECLIKAEVDCG